MRRAGFLRNDTNPATVSGSTFDVREGAVHLRVSGLAPGQSIPIEVRVGGSRLECGVTWAPLIRNGCPVMLSATNTDYIEVIKGTYRLAPGPAVGTIVVSYDEEEGQLDDKLHYTFLTNPPCDPNLNAPPPAPACCPVTTVTRYDPLTGELVTLLIESVGGVPTVTGYIGGNGVAVSGPYPSPLTTVPPVKEFDHSFFCDPATGNKVLVTTTYSAAGVPTVAGYEFPSLAPFTGALASLGECPGPDVESDAIQMCDNGTDFLRWVVKQGGVPTGTTYDTNLIGGVYTVAGTPVLGSCGSLCNPTAPVGLINSWG